MVKDPYRVLGVQEGADAETVKRAYRRLAKECHPDLHPNDPEANRRMQEINEAYDMLTRPGGWQRKSAPDYGAWQGARTTYGRPYTGQQQAWQYSYSAYRDQQRQTPVTVIDPFRLVLRLVGALLVARVMFRLFGFGLFWFFI